jgi:hypothetical protein
VITWSHTDNIRPGTEAAVKLGTDEGRGEETGDGWFVRDLKMGDVVTVWAKTRFAGWANKIEKVKIDVYWAV